MWIKNDNSATSQIDKDLLNFLLVNSVSTTISEFIEKAVSQIV